MARSQRTQQVSLPACYAMVHEGLEEIAADEIRRDLAGEVRKLDRGIVVFRVDPIDLKLLNLRTTEDVFLFGWGSDELTYRATDLDLIQKWTARQVDWQHLLRIHHGIRPKPGGKPTYRIVTQMDGRHVYQRRHAGEAFAAGLEGVIPASWRTVEENASVEFWLSIHEKTAICGLRLSDRLMRHRSWKLEHRPASLRPTIAAAMVRLAALKPGQVVLDPMCGVGTILAEAQGYAERFRGQGIVPLGGDVEYNAVRAAAINLRRLGAPLLCQWNARRLPLESSSVPQIISNPPFGKQLSTPNEIHSLYRAMIREYDRVLLPGGQAVLLVSEPQVLEDAIQPFAWNAVRSVRVRILGQPARIGVWRKREA